MINPVHRVLDSDGVRVYCIGIYDYMSGTATSICGGYIDNEVNGKPKQKLIVYNW